jgi:hypothetical protein
MAQTFAANATNAFNSTPIVKSPPAASAGRVRVLSDTITFASQADTDTIVVGGGYLPKNAQFLYGVITASATLGSATISIGTAASAAKYRAAAVFTSVNTPTLFGTAAGSLSALTAAEQILVTVGTAALPASGTLDIQLFYAID